MAFERKLLCWIPAVILIFILIYRNSALKNTPKAILYKEKLQSKWAIIVTVNDGYFDIFQNWYHYYRKLHLNYKLIVIAEDNVVFFKLQQLAGNVMFTLVRSWRNSVSEAVAGGSTAFSELASGRPSYILKYLENGVNVVYADVDAVWLQNPFLYFNGNFEMWMQSDDPNKLCTGLIAVHGNNETINLMQKWEASLKEHLRVDQVAFNLLIKKSHVRLSALDTNLFPSGKQYFTLFNDGQRSNVIIAHNNHLRSHPKKLQRFKQFHLWFS